MAQKKGQRAVKTQSTQASQKDSTSPEPPATVMQAIFRVVWDLPRQAKYAVILGTILVFGAYALWLSVPEKKREEAIDAMFNRETSDGMISLAEAQRRKLPVIVDGSLTVPEMKDLFVELRTTKGKVRIDLMPEVAPNHVRNFVNLAAHGFYDETRFHRVNPLILIQGGDPNTRSSNRAQWGRGGSSLTLKAEFSTTPHERGTVSMARRPADPDSATSQFFICTEPQPAFNGTQTVFGKVVQGMDVVDEIAAGARDHRTDQPHHPIEIEKAIVRRTSDGSEWNPHRDTRRGLTTR
jgi:peptidyl-prolyl cis-trans isomerase B (cyclophilin B)